MYRLQFEITFYYLILLKSIRVCESSWSEFLYLCHFKVLTCVIWQISDGSHPVTEDITPERGNVTFRPGQASAMFTVLIQDDKVITICAYCMWFCACNYLTLTNQKTFVHQKQDFLVIPTYAPQMTTNEKLQVSDDLSFGRVGVDIELKNTHMLKQILTVCTLWKCGG